MLAALGRTCFEGSDATARSVETRVVKIYDQVVAFRGLGKGTGRMGGAG
jgi:hypothetical protein